MTVTKPTNVNKAVVIIERCESRERARTPCPLVQTESLSDKEIDRQNVQQLLRKLAARHLSCLDEQTLILPDT